MALHDVIGSGPPGGSARSPVPVMPAAASPTALSERPPDTAVARAYCAQLDYGFGQPIVVRFERLRFADGRLYADVAVTRADRTKRESGVPIAGRTGFLTGGGLCRDDGEPDFFHRAVVRRLADVPVLDAWLDRLLGDIEGRLLSLVRDRADWLGPASQSVRLEPLAIPLRGRSGVRLAAEELRHDGALRGSLRLRVGTRLVTRVEPEVLVDVDGRFSPLARRHLQRAAPILLALRHRAALREALDALGGRLVALHRQLCAGEPPSATP